MKHRKIPPKKGVHPTQIVEICPNCNGPITKVYDIHHDILIRTCKCKYVHFSAVNNTPNFTKATDLKGKI